MAASSVDMAFEWTPFSHGFVYWEYPDSKHLPPADERGQREWLKGFLQAHADYPDVIPEPPDFEDRGETASESLNRLLTGHIALTPLLAVLEQL